MKNATGSCCWNIEINCTVGHVVKKHPELRDVLHCAKCGWNPEVERQRREEVRKRYGIKLQTTLHGGHEV